LVDRVVLLEVVDIIRQPHLELVELQLEILVELLVVLHHQMVGVTMVVLLSHQLVVAVEVVVLER
jgi:hypothetical protein